MCVTFPSKAIKGEEVRIMRPVLLLLAGAAAFDAETACTCVYGVVCVCHGSSIGSEKTCTASLPRLECSIND